MSTDLDAVLTGGAAAVAALYRSGSLSPLAVTAACLEAIGRRNGELGAFLEVTADAALAAAAVAERELADGRDRGPLHGIPVAVKDVIDVAGTVTTCGSTADPPGIAARDAELVRHVRDAGAVILGKTHLMEFALADFNPAFPTTRNPLDGSRTTSGSSSGSAAAVGAGLCFIAVGTDTAGSIRIPACYCGTVGLKPTLGLVSTAGVYPVSASLDTVGPITRTVADAAAALGAMTGKRIAIGRVAWKTLRIGVFERYAGDRVAPATAAVFEDLCHALRSRGARLEPVDLAGLDEAERMLMDIILPEAAQVHAIRRATAGEHYAAGTRALLDLGARVPATDYLRAQDTRRRLAAAAAELFGRFDALISPTLPTGAPARHPELTSHDGVAEMLPSALTNLIGAPGVTVPWGRDADGLPLGVHVSGAVGRDRHVLSLAAGFEALRV